MFFDHSFSSEEWRLYPKRRNRILQSLPAGELNQLKADLKVVELSKRAVLFEADRRADFMYFPLDCVISFLGDTGEGGGVEVWSVGNEGVGGLSGLFGGSKPFRGVVQVPGTAIKGKVSDLRRHFERCSGFHDVLL